jgi:hypothetical protein
MSAENQTPSADRTSVPARPRWPLLALTMICLLWAGMVMGISLLETPVKFTAPSLKTIVTHEVGRAIALDIGRVVFHTFNKVEIVWSVLTIALIPFIGSLARLPRAARILLPTIWLVVVFQSVVLVPALAARAQLVLHNQPLPPAPYHALYTGSELIKLLSLLALGVLLLRNAER